VEQSICMRIGKILSATNWRKEKGKKERWGMRRLITTAGLEIERLCRPGGRGGPIGDGRNLDKTGKYTN